MRHRIGVRALVAFALFGMVVVTACGSDPATGPGNGQTPEESAVDVDSLLAGLALEEATASEISAADMSQHIGVLAHDSMRGRLTGEAELEESAEYIAGVLEAAGVEPAGSEGYVDRWAYPQGTRSAWDDERAVRPPNVVGIVRGSDPALAGSYVVVSAHFDHIGTGPPDAMGDTVFNGADDNASGTAVLLEVAQALAALPESPRRSVVFVAVSGEELGLLGSAAWVSSPTVPLSGMVANVNLDMVSRGLPSSAWVIGYELTTMGPLAGAVSSQVEGLGLAAVSDVSLGQDLMARSDHFPFASSGVPALALFGGFHPHYHTREDEVDRVSADKAARMARLATYLVAAVATMDEEPDWTEAGAAYMSSYW